MANNRTIFDEIIDNLNGKISGLQQSIEKLRAENDELRMDIEATNKSISNMPWNEQTEARNDIRYYEGMIRTNDSMIKMYQDQIQQLEKEIQEAMSMKSPEITR